MSDDVTSQLFPRWRDAPRRDYQAHSAVSLTQASQLTSYIFVPAQQSRDSKVFCVQRPVFALLAAD